MKAVVYVQPLNTSEAKTGTSVADQLKSVKIYCRSNEIDIAKSFQEAQLTSWLNASQQVFSALAYCKKHFRDIDYFIVPKLDSIGSNREERSAIERELHKLGIQLHSVSEPAPPSPLIDLAKAMLATFEHFDNETRLNRRAYGLKKTRSVHGHI